MYTPFIMIVSLYPLPHFRHTLRYTVLSNLRHALGSIVLGNLRHTLADCGADC